jgi:hypothetical protein
LGLGGNQSADNDAGWYRDAVAAKYILGAFAVIFLATALLRLSRGGGIGHPQTKTWLLISAIFIVVSAWLFSQG